MMKVAMFYGPGEVKIETAPIPKPGPGEILVKNHVALTCGTDVKTFLRGHPIIIPPSAFGHEAAGTVAEVGTGVTGFSVGDKVVAHNSAPCNVCSYCKVGQHSMCENITFNSGAFSEYQLIPASIVAQNMYKFCDDISFADAALLEPFACAVYGIDESNIQLGDKVVVLGAGPIGLMFVRLAALKGAYVISTDMSESRLKTSLKLGAREAINIQEHPDPVQAVRETTNGKGVDVAIEAVGLPEAWEQAIAMVRKGGTVNLFGGTKPGTTVTIDTKLIHYSQLTLKGVFHTTPIHVERAYKLISQGAIKGEDFIGGEYTIDQVVDAINNHKEGRVIKNSIVF